MEQLTGPIEEGDHHQWSSLNGTFTITADEEEANFMAQLFNTTTTPAYPFMAALDNNNLLHEQAAPFERSSSSSFYRLSQESSTHEFSGGNYCSQLLLFPTENDDRDYCNNNNPMNFSFGGELGNINNNGGFNIFEDEEYSMNLEMSESNLQPCSKADLIIRLPEEEAAMEEEGHHKLEMINCKKRSRRFGDVQKRRNERSKKTQKLTSSSNTEEDGNAGYSRQSTSNYCSEDESNASLELNGRANNSGSSPKGPTKSRASRGSATDPQSLYARKRRERINERLKILQSLVPNGTKVDISTMLEEAVLYVKFLQLQIKLLSSDDLWMYAPIAYNGMDIGLNPTPNTPKEI